ncbi:MAG: TolC family protein [Woeseiaceae bacterium]
MQRLILFLALPSLAFTAATSAETLDDAWQAALAAHQQIAAAAAERDAANFDLGQAKAARLPRLGLNTAYTRLDQAPGFDIGGLTTPPIFDGNDFVSAGAEIRLPLYAGGGISAGISAAESGARAAESNLAAVTQAVKLGVAVQYVGVLRAERALDVAESNVDSLAAHTEDTKKRLEFGAVPQNDFLAASVSLADAQQRRLQAVNALDYARSAYNRTLGRPLTAKVTLDPSLDIDRILPAGRTLEDLIAMAAERRPELAALDLQERALHDQSDAARAEARPQLALTGGYMMLENRFLTDDRFWMAGISLQWNLFDGGRSRKHAASLDSHAAALGHRRADLDSMIALEVRRAWNDRIEAENRLQVAESAVAQATENLRVVSNRYKAGASTNTEVLDAESLREQSLDNRDNAHFSLALAKLRLARAVGLL